MAETLVVYYSYSGLTKSLAEDIAVLTNGDLRALTPIKPYTFTYNGATKEARQEIERGYCSKLLSGCESTAQYERIFIGSPNWFKAFAPPVLSFLRGVPLDGKELIPFCTHGGEGFGEIEINIKKECPKSKILPGFSSPGDHSEQQLQQWLNSL